MPKVDEYLASPALLIAPTRPLVASSYGIDGVGVERVGDGVERTGAREVDVLPRGAAGAACEPQPATSRTDTVNAVSAAVRRSSAPIGIASRPGR